MSDQDKNGINSIIFMIIHSPHPHHIPISMLAISSRSYLYIGQHSTGRVSIRRIVFVYSRQWRRLGLRPPKWTHRTHSIGWTASPSTMSQLLRYHCWLIQWTGIWLCCVFRWSCFNIQSIAVFQIDIRPQCMEVRFGLASGIWHRLNLAQWHHNNSERQQSRVQHNTIQQNV